MSRKKYKKNWKFERISSINRWKQSKISRNCDWVIFGCSWWWSGPKEKSFRIHLFGINIHIWFKLTEINTRLSNNNKPCGAVTSDIHPCDVTPAYSCSSCELGKSGKIRIQWHKIN